MSDSDTVIIGGGIAGLSLLRHLSEPLRNNSAKAKIVLFERERLCGTAATGRNAGIFRHIEHNSSSSLLALRSRELFADLDGGDSFLNNVGALYMASDPKYLESLYKPALETGISLEIRDKSVFPGTEKIVEGGEAVFSVFVPSDGVLDIHALTESLRRKALSNGSLIRCGTGIRRILCTGNRVSGVETESGEKYNCRRAVIAAGAWSSKLAGELGISIPLSSFRRHLVFLGTDKAPPDDGPVMWRLDEQVYARPESGGYLASPCDEDEYEPVMEPSVNYEVLSELGRRLSSFLPGISGSYVRRIWACLRTMSPDRIPVLGPDPDIEGLYWFAGLGGQGLSTGLAAGEMLAALMSGADSSEAAIFSPQRFR